MTRAWQSAAIIAIALLGAQAAHSETATFSCDVRRVVDGDTIRCSGMMASVRIWGIDAPDWHCGARRYCREDQPAAHAAREHLKEMIYKRMLSCVTVGVDRYKRIVARCTLNGVDIACAMVRAGHAKDMPRYSKGYYARCSP